MKLILVITLFMFPGVILSSEPTHTAADSLLLELPIAEISIRGAESLPALELNKICQKTYGRKTSSGQITKTINELLQLAENSGYPYAQIWVDSLGVTFDRASVYLRVQTGPLVIIRKIQFQGGDNNLVKPLQRVLILREGKPFSEIDFCRSVERLKSSRKIELTGEPRLFSGEDLSNGIVVFPVRQRNSSYFWGSAAYLPRAVSKGGLWVGGLELFWDFFGGFRSAQFLWNRKDQGVSDISLAYAEQFLLSLPLDVTFNMKQIERGTSYFHQQIGATLGWEPTGNWRVDWSGSWSKVIPRDQLFKGIFPARKYQLESGLLFRHLDKFYFARRGFQVRVSFGLALKRLFDYQGTKPPKAKILQQTISIETQTIVPLFSRNALFWRLASSGISSTEQIIPISDQIFLGGLSSLRGFRQDQFSGSKVVWSNLEYRIFFSEQTLLFLFIDGGYFYRNELQAEEPVRIERFKVGYGFGVTVSRPFGDFQVSLGWGDERRFSQGIVNFGLRNRF